MFIYLPYSLALQRVGDCAAKGSPKRSMQSSPAGGEHRRRVTSAKGQSDTHSPTRATFERSPRMAGQPSGRRSYANPWPIHPGRPCMSERFVIHVSPCLFRLSAKWVSPVFSGPRHIRRGRRFIVVPLCCPLPSGDKRPYVGSASWPALPQAMTPVPLLSCNQGTRTCMLRVTSSLSDRCLHLHGESRIIHHSFLSGLV